MKIFISLLTTWLALSAGVARADVKSASPEVSKIKPVWNSADQVEQPESVYFEPVSKYFFVSNVVGTPNQKDGKGWIQKLDANGKVVNAQWVTGLNAPKGLRSYKTTLWVSDIDTVVGIDLNSGKIISKTVAPASQFLNDVAVDSYGTVYVSDTFANKIFKLNNDKIEVFAEGPQLEGPNGLLVLGDELVVAAWGTPAADWSTKVAGRLYKLNLKNKKQTFISQKPLGHLDGLEIDDQGRFLVTDWSEGKLYRVQRDGAVTELLHGMKGSADIGFYNKTVIIPRMGENLITAVALTALQ